MAFEVLVKSLAHVLLYMMFTVEAVFGADIPPDTAPPGVYHTSWIGNSFGGGGAKALEGVGFRGNGYGYWVQDSIGAMAVAPDGTVFLGTEWDEAGRGIGLYKNGIPNRVLAFALTTPAMAFGGGSVNNAVCVDGGFFYIGNLSKGLLKFQWTPGDINSSKYLQTVMLPKPATALSCSNGKILVGLPDGLELRNETEMQLTATYPMNDLSADLLAPDGSFWVIAGNQVRHLRADGTDTGITVPSIGKPASLAWSNSGALIVTDNGPAQQVLFFDVLGQPKLLSAFGVKGGLYAGMPGAVAPQKLFALRGAATDADGNLYVGMGFNANPSGNTFIRAFSPSGNLLWEDYATAFLDIFGFEPGSDGTVVFGRTTRWQLDLNRQTPGTEAVLKAITVDPLRYPDDPRLKTGYSVEPKSIDGTQLLYANTQLGHGLVIFAGAPGTDILHQVGKTPTTGWSWFVDDDGGIWNGDASGKKIALYPLKSITGGQPVYDWQHPRTWPWPIDFQSVARIIYQKSTDSLYVFGYQTGQSDNGGWGSAGFTARRYDGWLSGHPSARWTNTSVPGRPGASPTHQTQPGKDVSLAGNYIFVGMVRDGVQRYASKVVILDAITGQYVGTLQAGPEVGGFGGWEDMVGSIHATKRANGEYLILVEDDWRAKNLLFRWTP